MPKLSVLGKVKRVAQSKRESESSPSDDELESANLSLEVDPFASVFDVEGDESVSIASRVSRRRSSARLSKGGLNVSFSSPAKNNEPTPKRRRASSAKKANKDETLDIIDKENSNGNKERRTSKNNKGGLQVQEQEPVLQPDEVDTEPRPWCLEDFSVGKSIGRGKFGNVYLAKQKATSKGGQTTAVALKTLHKSALINAGIVHNLRREVEIQSRLKHPNIVQLYGYFENTKTVSLILQHITGGEMYKHVHRYYEEGRLDERLCRVFMHDVLSALSYMHDRHVYHRDLKGENLFLNFTFDMSCASQQGLKEEECPEHVRVMIGDLGASAHAPPPSATRYTWCGTYEYLSPEMVNRAGHRHHVDLWACGILLFELLAGYTPFSILMDHEEEEEEEEASTARKMTATGRKTAQTPSCYNDDDKEEEEEDEDDSPIFANIRRHAFGAVRLPSGHNKSNEAENLINLFLNPDPEARPEAKDALNHPWMTMAALNREYSLRR